jgi:ADP-ribose pyrophosphatase YjhB (NUDIX family)
MSTEGNRILSFLAAQHQPFGSWREEWLGVPLEFKACLSGELPPRELIGSVRALVLRGDDVLVSHMDRPWLMVGGRMEQGETVEQTLLREVAEETGWIARPIAVIGFIHVRHLDGQRPDWGRPAPHFLDPVFGVEALRYDPTLIGADDMNCRLVAMSEVEQFGLEEVNLTFLRQALLTRGPRQ